MISRAAAAQIGALARRALASRKRTVALLLVYFALRLLLRFTSGEHGLVTPEGRIDFAFGALALSVLALRLVVLFIVVPSLAYALVSHVAGRRG